MRFIHGIIMLSALGRAVCAQTAPPARLDDLIAEALAKNPEVLAAQKSYEAARQRPLRAGSMPDPSLSVGYQSNGGPLPGFGLGSNPTSNIGVMVTQEIPYAGKRKLRSDIALKEADAEFQQYQAVELNVRSRVTQAFHRLHHTYASLENLAQAKELLSGTIRVSEARYAAGKASQQDIFKAQVRLSMIETRIIQMQQDQRTAEAEINSLLNRQPGIPVGRPIGEKLPALTMTLEELLTKAAGTAPDLKRGQQMIERDELAVNLARREFHPDYTVSAGYFNQGAMPPMFQMRVDIPLRLHSERNQRPALNEQVDLLAAARRNFEAGEQSLVFRVSEAYYTAEAAWRLAQLYGDTILPQTQMTVDSSLAAYQNGRTEFSDVVNNLGTKVDVEEQLHEQELNYGLALARLEEMTGVELRKGGSK